MVAPGAVTKTLPALWLLEWAEQSWELAKERHPRPPHPTTTNSIWVAVDVHLRLSVQLPSVLLLAVGVVDEARLLDERPLLNGRCFVVGWRMRLLAAVPLLNPPPLPPPQNPQQPQCSGHCHHECPHHGAFLEAMLQRIQCFQCLWAQATQGGWRK